MLRLRLALPLVRRRLLDLRVRLGACACSTLLAQDDTAGGRNHGIVYANGIFSREHQAKLLATSGPYQGLGLALVKTDAPTTEFIPTSVGEALVSPARDHLIRQCLKGH